MSQYTDEQIRHIQSICREWLSNPATTRDTLFIMPADDVVPHAVSIEIQGILTFDDVLIRSAVDAETRVCYTKHISRWGDPGTFIDAPSEMIAPAGAPLVPDSQTIGQTKPEATNASTPSPRAREPVTFKEAETFDFKPPEGSYLFCSNEVVLGYSLLEKTRSQNQRSGRFIPSDDYYEVADMFQDFPQAENDCLEANAREAYGLVDDNAGEYRKVFNALSLRIDALKLYLSDDKGGPLNTIEVRLEDLSKYYDDPSERWLHVQFAN